MKKKLLIFTTLIAINSLKADGDFGAGFATGAFTGATLGVVASHAGRPRSDAYYEDKSVRRKARNINKRINHHEKQAKKHERKLNQLHRRGEGNSSQADYHRSQIKHHQQRQQDLDDA